MRPSIGSVRCSCRSRRRARGGRGRSRRRWPRGRASETPTGHRERVRVLLLESVLLVAEKTEAASRFRKPCSSSCRCGWCNPAVALNGTSSRRKPGRAPRDGERSAPRSLRSAPSREAQLADLQDAKRDVVAQRTRRRLGGGVEENLGIDPRRLDRLDPLVGRRELTRIDHDGEAQRLVSELAKLRCGTDEAVHDPAVVALLDAPVLGEPLRRAGSSSGGKVGAWSIRPEEERLSDVCRHLTAKPRVGA